MRWGNGAGLLQHTAAESPHTHLLDLQRKLARRRQDQRLRLTAVFVFGVGVGGSRHWRCLTWHLPPFPATRRRYTAGRRRCSAEPRWKRSPSCRCQTVPCGKESEIMHPVRGIGSRAGSVGAAPSLPHELGNDIAAADNRLDRTLLDGRRLLKAWRDGCGNWVREVVGGEVAGGGVAEMLGKVVGRGRRPCRAPAHAHTP